ncbi:NAD-dependent epimerase/dehydratase family protein [Nocardioides panacis]|uniref:NAD-dependent epimerase/dehydratase family protein n=1 Tax=Nocardioides panacis TaxID=2849501 RepID=A0A975XZ94_9ACTN|nr:NAD-dependent epimerase/dehydratase family protein [Nocardioides panacis]QWZ07191.1 NAD-dependent epimerase/dehydratase family protein [Nocardioides panacis]
MGRVVLVTGVSRDFGGRFARRIAADPAVERVIGVDVVPPRGDLGSVAFVRADIRNPVIAKVITGQDVDTVVHMSVRSAPHEAGGRMSMKEHNVIGTMQLLAACQKAPGLERLVVKSSSAVYGSSSRDPAMFTEDMGAKRMPRSGYAKDVLEVEGYVRGFARRRPDVAVTMLRAANAVGPTVSSPLTHYFRLPVVPTVLGYDARLQFLHETDLLGALHHATLGGVHGTFNVGGDGVLMLSQALRRLGRPTVPVPRFALGSLSSLGSLSRQAAIKGLQAELSGFLTFGRGLDTSRMRSVLGFHPSYTTAEAFADLSRSIAPSALPSAAALLGGASRG